MHTLSQCVHTTCILCIHISFVRTYCVYTEEVIPLCFPTLPQAKLVGQWLKMIYRYGYGEPARSGDREVFIRVLNDGSSQEVDVESVTSHIVKHGAADNAGSSDIPTSVLMQASVPLDTHTWSGHRSTAHTAHNVAPHR